MANMVGYIPPKRKNPREEALKRRLRLQATQQAATRGPQAPKGAQEQDETVKKRKRYGY
jgi:hypothetical protein